jgi:hypothetical protein
VVKQKGARTIIDNLGDVRLDELNARAGMRKTCEVRMLAGDWLNYSGNPLIGEALYTRIDRGETTKAKNVSVSEADAKDRIIRGLKERTKAMGWKRRPMYLGCTDNAQMLSERPVRLGRIGREVADADFALLAAVTDHVSGKRESQREQDERRRTRVCVARSEGVEVISKVERTAVRRSLHRVVGASFIWIAAELSLRRIGSLCACACVHR